MSSLGHPSAIESSNQEPCSAARITIRVRAHAVDSSVTSPKILFNVVQRTKRWSKPPLRIPHHSLIIRRDCELRCQSSEAVELPNPETPRVSSYPVPVRGHPTTDMFSTPILGPQKWHRMSLLGFLKRSRIWIISCLWTVQLTTGFLPLQI